MTQGQFLAEFNLPEFRISRLLLIDNMPLVYRYEQINWIG